MSSSTNGEDIIEVNAQKSLLIPENIKEINRKSDNELISVNIKTIAKNHKDNVSEKNKETSSLLTTKTNLQRRTSKQENTSNNIVISNENSNEENTTEQNNEQSTSISDTPSNINISSTCSNNATEENALLASQQQQMMLQMMNILVTNQPVLLNFNLQQQLGQQEGKLTKLGDLATFFFFILYLADIWSDMSLAVYFVSVGKYEYGYTVLIPVYVSSLITAIFERETRKVKTLKYHFLWGFIVFIFNLSGVLLYLEITYMLYRKLSKKSYSKSLLNSKQQTLKILKTAEACFEAYPQIYFQTKILSDSVVANEHVTWLQYVSIATSTLGLIFSIVGFLVSVTQNYPNTNIFGKIIKYLWLIFDTVLFLALSLTIIMPAVSSLSYNNLILFTFILFFIYPFFNAYLYMEITVAHNLLNLQRNILMIFLSTSSYFPFELKCFNNWKPILARIILIVGVILLTVRWYFYRNEICMNLPFTFDFINYISILCFVLGLFVIILVTIQIIRVPRIRSEYNVLHYILFFSH